MNFELPLHGDLEEIAKIVRERIVSVTSKNGGHVAPSLGTVELTVALLSVFNLKEDHIIWDVGHQSYAYKILTGRDDRFDTLRKLGGISGFPNRSESPFDLFGTGHGGTSISAGLGLKEAMTRAEKEGKQISIIGDGAMTSGLAFEAMNHVEELGKNHVTILNDNDMFISTGVGALSRWFSRTMTGPTYASIRSEIKDILHNLPPFFRGPRIIKIIQKALNSSKSLLTPGMLFEGFGYQYVGPIDGHNINELVETFRDIKDNNEPLLIHVVTIKGKGYPPAENNPRKFHGVAPFNKKTGEIIPSGPSFTAYLKEYLPHLFKRDKKLVAITAAMPDGTGLSKLQELAPDRVYDAGMSEGHAVTFAAGLAAGGLHPVVAIYSTFLQRALDNIVHDVALQNLPVIFLVDRGGLVGDDGGTHHGLFDISYLRMIPNITLMAPRDEHQMVRMIEAAVLMDSPVAIRYPRGTGSDQKNYTHVSPLPLKGEWLVKQKTEYHTVIISVGSMVREAKKAVKMVGDEGIDVALYDLRIIKPLPNELFEELKQMKVSRIVTVEEGIVAGGAGSAIMEELAQREMNISLFPIGVEDTFSTHGTQQQLREMEGLTADDIANAVKRGLNG
ncbi:1-deoxy-D-xylulose-5-phosphate synthase [bacterium]|nr:1-deoxy-D-xylulose-5-phosphate synthase [bacterium]